MTEKQHDIISLREDEIKEFLDDQVFLYQLTRIGKLLENLDELTGDARKIWIKKIKEIDRYLLNIINFREEFGHDLSNDMEIFNSYVDKKLEWYN